MRPLGSCLDPYNLLGLDTTPLGKIDANVNKYRNLLIRDIVVYVRIGT